MRYISSHPNYYYSRQNIWRSGISVYSAFLIDLITYATAEVGSRHNWAILAFSRSKRENPNSSVTAIRNYVYLVYVTVFVCFRHFTVTVAVLISSVLYDMEYTTFYWKSLKYHLVASNGYSIGDPFVITDLGIELWMSILMFSIHCLIRIGLICYPDVDWLHFSNLSFYSFDVG